MRKTLYLKFILAYFIFGFFGFIVVATFVPNMTFEHLKREKAEDLYSEATLIAGTYASGLYTNETSLDTVKSHLDALGVYLSANIWIINPSGRIVLDSSSPLDVERVSIIEDFDPTDTAGSYYTVSTFYDYYEEEMLSVYAPITAEYKVRGYVVINYSMGELQRSCNSLLTISYITLCILFLLSLIILIFFTEMVYVPLKKITYATEQYATLNNLNTKGMLLERTDFDINRTIRNVAAAFEGTCKAKKIAIELIFTGDILYVNADMEKIQQVLYNLLDNAIKFSHHDSVIKIETSEKKNKGVGIPKDDLKMIFDRFYKSDASRGKDKKGTGLGLSITKEIIQSHEEHINVISTPGVGSEFIFSLALSDQNDEEE